MRGSDFLRHRKDPKKNTNLDVDHAKGGKSDDMSTHSSTVEKMDSSSAGKTIEQVDRLVDGSINLSHPPPGPETIEERLNRLERRLQELEGPTSLRQRDSISSLQHSYSSDSGESPSGASGPPGPPPPSRPVYKGSPRSPSTLNSRARSRSRSRKFAKREEKIEERTLLEVGQTNVEEINRQNDEADAAGEDVANLPRYAVEVIRRSRRTQGSGTSNPRPPAGQAITTSIARSNTDSLRDNAAELGPPIGVKLSMVLMRAIGEITGISFNARGTVFFAPFKLFMLYEKKIREFTVKLSQKLGDTARDTDPAASRDATGSESPRATSKNRPASEADTKPQTKDSDSTIALDAKGEHKKTKDLKRRLAELELLVRVFDTDLKSTFQLHRDAADGRVPEVTFGQLWHLFQPGVQILAPGGGNQVYLVVETTGGGAFKIDSLEIARRVYGKDHVPEELEVKPVGKTTLQNPFLISCVVYDFDGRSLGPVQSLLPIKAYEGKRAVTALPYVPLRYLRNKPDTIPYEDLVKRGKKFVELIKSTDTVHMNYQGLTLNDIKEQIESEIVIDARMAFLKNPSWQPRLTPITNLVSSELRIFDDYKKWFKIDGYHADDLFEEDRCVDFLETNPLVHEKIEDVEELKEEDYLICSSKAFGFILRSRKWAIFDVNFIYNIVYEEGGFEFLVLPKGHDKTLLALVKTHAKANPLMDPTATGVRQMDTIKGKGKGLIILLHGEPGVGKTSTAECIAQYTKRPLFQMTCGDIGDTSEKVEERLESHFQLAHRWGCVLLIDEADVFLMARDKADLARNAIVSVFLRVLEYYPGILFLTTNRVGTFDPAFRSRIHMSLFYPKLDETATLKIWENNLQRVKDLWSDTLTIEHKDEKEIIAFAREHYIESAKMRASWNGRQIRNAFQTAIALSEYEAQEARVKFKLSTTPTPRLEKSHFDSVAKASKHFDKYITETQGAPDDVAREKGERRDDFDMEQSQWNKPKFQPPK